MAMLAEPRRKQKWTLNPRGKQWSDDSTKFGQKMLEKMGWSSGKGLGANEQGMTEHVKISYKNDQSGIGFKDSGDQWTQHQADFNSFLVQLQEQNSIGTTINAEGDESLELKSKQSKARVHYHKFTRGKDVKKYSTKDLANIFGKKDLKDATETSKPEEVEDVTEEVAGTKDNRGGVLTIKGGNIDEYFKNKLPNFMKMAKNSSGRDDRDGSDSDECEAKLGFGYSSAKENCDTAFSGFAFTNEGLDLGYSESANDSKKKKVEFTYDNPCLDLQKRKRKVEKNSINCSNEGFVNPALDLVDLASNKCNGAEFEIPRVEFGLDNDALDLSDENSRKKRVTFNDKVEYSTDVCKKKRKGKGKLDKFEVDNGKLKKKAKQSSAASESVASNELAGFVNEALDIEVFSEEANDNEMNERKTKKSKRKKNRRASNLETIEEAADEGGGQLDESEIGEAVLLDEGIPRKSKKSKRISNVEANSELNEVTPEIRKKDKHKKYPESVTIDAGQEHVPEESQAKTKSDKKKQKGNEEAVEITVLAETLRKKKKRKHKKEKNENTESDNGEQKYSDIQVETIDITEVKKKTKKKVKLNTEGEQNGTAVTLNANDQADITSNGGATKRKSSDVGNFAKSPKKCKIDQPSTTDNAENFMQNGDISVESTPPALWDKKGSKSKKIFKSLFAKAPTLLFTGSNINEMVGYGADFADIKRCVQEKC